MLLVKRVSTASKREVFDGNIASARVLTKCGMQLEGVARQKYRKDGKWIDAAQYAILKKDHQ